MTDDTTRDPERIDALLTIEEVAELLRTEPPAIPDRVRSLLERLRGYESELGKIGAAQRADLIEQIAG
ncbi:MAG: hypothetical protein ACRDWY_19070, partial [Actinomycetes bacterium]